MKKLICVILALALCCSLSGCVTELYGQYVGASGNVPSFFGLMYLTIQTDSMLPTFSAGDKIICEKVSDPATLEAGDIIAYWTVIEGQRVINIHRIVEIYAQDGYLVFQTKGDNNDTVDPLTVHQSEVIGKYLFKSVL